MQANVKKTARCAAIVAFLAVLFGQGLGLTACSPSGYVYQVPEQTNDGWTTGSLSDVGIDATRITSMMNALSDLEEHPLHSILVVKDGKLVFEEYFSGEDIDIAGGLHFVHKDFDCNTLHCQASASKSITSILVGIAIDQGRVRGTGERLFSFFPEYSDLSDAAKDDITLQHLLTMSSGIPWDEDSYPFTDPRNDVTQMVAVCSDPIGFVLEKPLVASPGELFIYNSGTTNLLGEVVRRSTGLALGDFADRYLFSPLGITSFDWTVFPNAPEVAVASSLLYLRPRDMCKIGQLFLQKGMWNGSRVVSQDWVAESTRESMAVPPEQIVISGFNTSYGYQWWRGTFSNGGIDTYYAAGWGGQIIFVLPDVEMVAVFTAGNYEGSYEAFYTIVNDHILTATKDLN